MKDIVIIGAGGLAREVLMLIEDINKKEDCWNILGLLESTKKNIGNGIGDYNIIGDLSYLDNKNPYIVCAIGDSVVRKRIIESLNQKSSSFVNLIHPNVILGNNTNIGVGTIIFPNSIITTDITVGNHVFLSLNSLVSHDCVIKDFSTILPGCRISGNVNIGETTTIGTGATIIQGINIGKESYVGAGSVVINDVKDNSLVVGVPAKKIKDINKEQVEYE